MPFTEQFRTLQSGDPVQVTLQDSSILNGNIRRLVADETLILTTPLNENDPDLQTIHYIQDYVSMVSPVPAPVVAQAAGIPPSTQVRVKFRSQDSSDLTGVLTGVDAISGTIQVTDGTDVYVCKDFWWFEIL